LPEDEQRLSIGEEVGAMQFRFYGEQIKNDERRKQMSIKKKVIKKSMYEKKMSL
jgi:hypothetical protein